MKPFILRGIAVDHPDADMDTKYAVLPAADYQRMERAVELIVGAFDRYGRDGLDFSVAEEARIRAALAAAKL